MNIFSRLFVFLCLTAISLISITTVSAQKITRHDPVAPFPTTNDTQIVFCYAGEIYTVGKEGGIARRLTSGPGYSSFPRFSPDGKQIAFTSQYDGNTEVYVMPAEGGAPKRLTTSATLGRDDISTGWVLTIS
jgi:tricorn protease